VLKFKVRDWVRFIRDGRLVIAEVQYTKADALGVVYVVDHGGEVRESEILEARSDLKVPA
jgi:hypothetical protein